MSKGHHQSTKFRSTGEHKKLSVSVTVVSLLGLSQTDTIILFYWDSLCTQDSIVSEFLFFI